MTVKARHIVVAINPTASFGRNKAVGARIVERLRAAGHEVTALEKSSYRELLDASHAAVAGEPDAFVVVGGDGMVNLGANVTAETGVPLGIIPSGTGNDMARALGIPHDDADAAVETLLAALENPALEIDAGLITRTDEHSGEKRSSWFACMISAGFDALANERANAMTFPKGASRYIIALVVELAKLKPIDYRLVLDGTEIVTQGALVSIGNGVSLGGGMKVTPDAMLDDGQFDVLVVQPMSRTSFMRIFPRVFAGTHVVDSRVHVYRAAHVVLESKTVVAYADGDRLGPLPIEVQNRPGALHVLAPQPRFESTIVIAK
ncbi:diacylglycerol kinase [soil metagenome]